MTGRETDIQAVLGVSPPESAMDNSMANKEHSDNVMEQTGTDTGPVDIEVGRDHGGNDRE